MTVAALRRWYPRITGTADDRARRRSGIIQCKLGYLRKSGLCRRAPARDYRDDASVHRNYNPTRQDVTQVLDIAENIVQSIYVSAEQAKALKKRIPPRAKRKKDQ